MKIIATTALILSTLATAGCEQVTEEDRTRSLGSLNVIDATNLNDVMLSSADPNAAVDFFRASLAEEPDRVEFQRGYAQSLARAGRQDEAAIAYEQLDAAGNLEHGDRLGFAEALIRQNAWDRAEAQISLVPVSPNNYRYNQLSALVADHYERWDQADNYYAAARSLTSRPTAILNNWGVSKLSRGDTDGAIRHFSDAVRFDGTSFSAKNNLVLARGLQRNYSLPAIPMDGEERAQLYHNLAVVALRQGDDDVARGLLENAVESHPRYFEAAANKLAALQTQVQR